jgi:hypothetical protein
MDQMLAIANVLMRWLHVGSAAAALGVTLAMRLIVLPALERLPNGAEVLDALRPKLKAVIHGALGLAIVTGIYNYVVVAIPKVRAAKELAEQTGVATKLTRYHPVIGVKILLSLALFTLAILLLKPVPSMHENRKTWLSVNLVLGLLVFLLGAYLRRLW